MNHASPWSSAGAVAFAVFAAAAASYGLSLHGFVSMWLPSGVLLGLLLQSPPRQWLAILASAWAGNFAADLWLVGRVLPSLLGPVANCIEAAAAAWACRALAGTQNPVLSLRGVGALVVGAAIVSNAVTSFVGAAALSISYGNDFAQNWRVWWIGDGIGMLIGTPVVLGLAGFFQEVREAASPRTVLARSGLLLALLLAVVLVAFDHQGALDPFRAALVFPVLIAGSIGTGPGAHVLVMALAVTTISFSAAGKGPLVAPGMTPLEVGTQVFAFLGIAATSVLVLSAAIAERRRADRARERMQQQLHQAQKMEAIGRLTGGIAHDFNNMLTVLLGHADLAGSTLREGHPARAHLDEIRTAAQRSANLTRQLLGFARRQTVAPREIDLDADVGAMRSMLQRLVGERIELRWQPGCGVSVHIDPTQLQQVLMNLCANARDAMDGAGRIELATSVVDVAADERENVAPGRYAVLRVRDDGRGMDRATLERAFEPFFTTKPLDQGTGLGLASVYGIVQQNAGFVHIDSVPGDGTEVRVHLPCGTARVAAAQGAAEPRPRSQRDETLLLVDDDLTILDLEQRTLETQGYRVLATSSPREAIALCRDHGGRIDALVTDVMMPGMNGRELAAQLAGEVEGLRVLYTSGYTAEGIGPPEQLGPRAAFLAKPYTPDELARRVRELLDRA